MASLRVYASDVDDNLRWQGFPFREGDIVISTRSKHGTTWMQRICALLVFGGADLPGPLTEVSPWLDWIPEPLPDLLERLGRQRHRRFIKTHTPLDGVPADARATYVVVARDPLDARVSLYHQSRNIDRTRMARLMGDDEPQPDRPAAPVAEVVRDWALAPAGEWLESRTGVLHHVADAWSRARAAEQDPTLPRVVLVHYSDLCADLEAEMRGLADELALQVDAAAWPTLVRAASFEQMRAQADRLAPAPPGLLRDRGAFFRAGGLGEGRAMLSERERREFEERCRSEAPGEVVDWLLR